MLERVENVLKRVGTCWNVLFQHACWNVLYFVRNFGFGKSTLQITVAHALQSPGAPKVPADSCSEVRLGEVGLGWVRLRLG